MCALLSTAGTLLRVPRPSNLLSTLERRWVAAVALNRDMGQVTRLPLLRKLPATALSALRAPRTALAVADIAHQEGLHDARLQDALLCMAAAEGGMSLVVSVSLQHVKDALQPEVPHATQPWESTPGNGCGWRERVCVCVHVSESES